MATAVSASPTPISVSATILDQTQAAIQRFVVLTEPQAIAVGLWAIHTHCFQQFETTPYLLVTSPEKGCGKTRLLETVELLVARPESCTQPSPAVIYRLVETYRPTVARTSVGS
jgi:putative DNA primase/helicase